MSAIRPTPPPRWACPSRLAPRAGGVVRARGRTCGLPPGTDGLRFWFPPTVLAPVSPADVVFREEVFGPVVAVVPFDDEDDAVRLANDTPYGLSGSIWTENLGRALRVARGSRAATRRSTHTRRSATGRRSAASSARAWGGSWAPDVLDAFTEVKNVFIGTDRSQM